MTEPTIRRLAGEEILARLDELAEVLLDCVEGGASVSFMWPLPRERALAFWRDVGESVAGDERLLLVAEAEGRIV
ncbi:GNAT family N-acetyltransferase, partial [Pseudomonas aeruginosa]|nr:GNAT family N-acetyltransferase [Pseudomonas aeruginosa]